MSDSHTQKPVPPPKGKERFRLDREALAANLSAEGEDDEGCGLQHFGDSPAEQIKEAVRHAEDNHALLAPVGFDLCVLGVDANAVILTIRESSQAAMAKLDKRRSAALPIERQIATWHIEPVELSEGEASTFGGLCLTLETVCEVANGLMPCLRALLDGEQLLLDLINEPLTVLAYDLRARMSRRRTSVQDLAEWDADTTRDLWPLLIEVLETGEANEDWDGDRQRSFQLELGGEPHLARQLVEARTAVLDASSLPADALPEPRGGFTSYLA